MPNFKCQNMRCTEYEKSVFINKVTWVFDNKLFKLVTREKIKCQECNLELSFIEQSGDIKCSLLRFESMSPEQKRKVMVKRNREHYEKNDKSRVENMKKQILKDNRDQFLKQ